MANEVGLGKTIEAGLVMLAKRDAAVTCCGHASDHAASYGGRPWRHALIPHDAIADNMTVRGLVRRFGA